MRQALLILAFGLLLFGIISLRDTSSSTRTPPVSPTPPPPQTGTRLRFDDSPPDADALALLPSVDLLQAPDGTATRTLTVLLYPYIPDSGNDNFLSYKNRIRDEFMALYPDIDLNIIMDTRISVYSTDMLQSIFLESGVQVVELDLMMLGYVQERDWIVPINPDYSLAPYLESSRVASTIGGTVYAMPSRLCSVFLFGHDPIIQEAENTPTYLEILSELDPNHLTRGLVGEFSGSTALSTYYTAFYTGNYSYSQMEDAFIDYKDPFTIQQVAETFDYCTFDENNQCLNHGFANDTEAAIAFANGEGLTYLGFSEALYHMENASRAPVYVRPAPFGTGFSPILYADGLALNRQTCDAQCQADAELFAEYYASVETQVWQSLSLDVPDSLPRYMLSATADFYNDPQILAIPVYETFSLVAQVGQTFPSEGFAEARNEMYPAICEAVNAYLGFDACH